MVLCECGVGWVWYVLTVMLLDDVLGSSDLIVCRMHQ